VPDSYDSLRFDCGYRGGGGGLFGEEDPFDEEDDSFKVNGELLDNFSDSSENKKNTPK
jgi:hypothetical protein